MRFLPLICGFLLCALLTGGHLLFSNDALRYVWIGLTVGTVISLPWSFLLQRQFYFQNWKQIGIVLVVIPMTIMAFTIVGSIVGLSATFVNIANFGLTIASMLFAVAIGISAGQESY